MEADKAKPETNKSKKQSTKPKPRPAKVKKYVGFAEELKIFRRLISTNLDTFYAQLPGQGTSDIPTKAAFHTWELGYHRPKEHHLLIVLKFFASRLKDKFHPVNAQRMWKLCGYPELTQEQLGYIFEGRLINKPDLTIHKMVEKNQIFFIDNHIEEEIVPGPSPTPQPEISEPQSMLLAEYPGWITALAWSPDSQYVAAITAPGMVYNMATLVGLKKISNYNSNLLIYSFANQQLYKREGAHSGWGDSVDWSKDNQFIASGGQDNQILLWEVGNWELSCLKEHSARVIQVRFHPFDDLLASVDNAGTLIVWDLKQKTSLSKYKLNNEVGATGIAWLKDGVHLLMGCLDGSIYLLYRSENGFVEERRLTGQEEWIYSLSVSPDNQFVAARGQFNTIKIWQLDYPGPIKELKGLKDTINCLEWSPTYPFLAGASDDGTIVVWDTRSWQIRHVLEFEKKPSKWNLLPGAKDLNFRRWVRTLRWSPDGKYLAGANNTGQILVWKIV